MIRDEAEAEIEYRYAIRTLAKINECLWTRGLPGMRWELLEKSFGEIETLRRVIKRLSNFDKRFIGRSASRD